MSSEFYSLPYDGDNFGSSERLIDRDLSVNDRENHKINCRNSEERLNNINRYFDIRNGRDPTNLSRNDNRDLIDFDLPGDFRSNFPNSSFLINENEFRSDGSASFNNLAASSLNDVNERTADLRNRRNFSGPHEQEDSEHSKFMNEQKYRQYLTSCYSYSDRCTSSLPATFDNYIERSQVGGNGYGSVPGGDEMSTTDPPLTYCVHGKPGSGCCATLLNQPSAPTINISVEEHCHVKERDTGVNRKARRQIIVVSSLCLFFMIAEAAGGYFSGSLAIATDAAHLLTDFAGFMISLFALFVAARKPSRIMPFGWHRAEVIGAMLSVLTIWLVTGILVYLAVERIIHQDFEIDATVMLITSAVGVVVNIIMALTLHRHSHVHSHGGGSGRPALENGSGVSEGHQTRQTKEQQNINVRAAFIHIIGDLLQSVGVFIAATVIYYKPEWSMIDPICTFLFSALVLATTFSIMKDTLLVLMEGIPRDVDYNDVLSTLLAIDGVIRVHNLRIWALSLDKTALSAHLAIAPSADCTEILKGASKEIHKKYNFFEMTLQIEYFQQNMETCAQCQVPS